MTTVDDRPPPIEPGERAQAFLRIADEAFTVGGYVKAQAAATLAGVYLEAAELDMKQRAARGVVPAAFAKDIAGRLELARQALIQYGGFTSDEVGDDIAPRIIEALSR